MDRPIIYSMEMLRAFDVLSGYVDTMKGIGWLARNVLGVQTIVASGFTATATSPATMSFDMAEGEVYQAANIDTNIYGVLPVNTGQLYQQAHFPGGRITLTTAGLSAGQSQWALLTVNFVQTDVVRTNDPNSGILPYYNAANPSQPLQGLLGSGTAQPTIRLGNCNLNLVYGTPATTGSQVPPTPSGSTKPLFLILLTYGQTQITQGQILVAAPSCGVGVPADYPRAPLIAGLLNQHHKGIDGHAPKINLTTEVTGVLPPENGGVYTASPQPANTVCAGPPSGPDAVPGFRHMGHADMPSPLDAVQAANMVFIGPSSGSNAYPAFRYLVNNDLPQTQQSFFTADGTWTCPSGVNHVWLTGTGGGGGGYGLSSAYHGGGGGAASAIRVCVPVTAGTTYDVVIGQGGAGGSTTPGDGTDTVFRVTGPGSVLLTINKGAKGGSASGGAGGAKGSATVAGENGEMSGSNYGKGGDTFHGRGSILMTDGKVYSAKYGGGGAGSTTGDAGLAGANGFLLIEY